MAATAEEEFVIEVGEQRVETAVDTKMAARVRVEKVRAGSYCVHAPQRAKFV